MAPAGSPGPADPSSFTEVVNWSMGEREMRLGREQGILLFNRTYPNLKLSGDEPWLRNPSRAAFQDSPAGRDWHFRFESPEGYNMEMVVRASGSVEGLGVGTGR